MRILPLATRSARLGLARRLRDGLEAARDQLRRHAAAGGAAARSAQARADRRAAQAAAAAGQLKPIPGAKTAPPEAADPRTRVDRPTARHACSRPAPATSTPSRSIPSPTARSIRSMPRPARSPTSRSSPASSSSAPAPSPPATPCAGSSATPKAGPAPTKRVHILVKPTRPDLVTNLIINTDRRTYHLELRSDDKTYMASVSWAYAQDQLIALRRQNAAADAAAPVATGVDINALNFRYRIEGDNPAWRPLRAFDDGRQVFIEFPAGIGQGEMPPLWVIGAEGGAELVNYRVQGNHMIVDRLFAAAELRLGGEHQKKVRIVRTDGRPQS